MPIETGCTHCGSDQHNTTECPMTVSKGWSPERPEVPGSRPPEQPKPRPYDYQSVPEVAGIGRDTDHPRAVVLYLRKEPSDGDLRAIQCALRDQQAEQQASAPDADQLALDAATDIMALMYGPTPAGGSVQLQAQVQCRVLDAINSASQPAAAENYSTTSDRYRAELYDEVWQKARDMGYGNVTEALAALAGANAQPAAQHHSGGVTELVEALEQIVQQYPNPDINHVDYRVHACRHAETALVAYRTQQGEGGWE